MRTRRKRTAWSNLSTEIASGEVAISMMWHLPLCGSPLRRCWNEWCDNAHWHGAVPVFNRMIT